MKPNPYGEAIVASARTVFDARKRSFIDVPEWPVDGPAGTKVPARIYYDPISTEEYYDLYGYRQEDGQHYAMAHVVAMKSIDAEGNRLFTAEHELMFCKMVDAGPIIRIANAILVVKPIEVVEKNSSATPSG